MQSLYYVISASAIVWLGLGAYIAFIAKRQKTLNNRLDYLEQNHDQN